jgi:N-acetylglutamate synthase-like GNAT family acetyltransferase
VSENNNGVRPWDPLLDLPRLVEVNTAAGRLFVEHGLVLPEYNPTIELLAADHVLVANAPHPVGFAILNKLDGHAHLAELAVHPDYGKRGIGSTLLRRSRVWAEEQGYRAITLTTFVDIPWNAPFYAARGFTEFAAEEWGPGLRDQWAAEREAGIMVAPRVAMISSW